LLSADGTTSSACAAAAKVPVSTARQKNVSARILSMGSSIRRSFVTTEHE
jgi:hypothetical protein